MAIAKKYFAFNETKTLKEWSKDLRCKVSYSTLAKRLFGCKSKWSVEDAIVTNKLKKKECKIFGETKTLKEWSRDNRCKVNFQTLNSRINTYKWDAEQAMITPLLHNKAEFFIGKIFNYVLIQKIVNRDTDGNAIVECKCLYKNCDKIFICPLRVAKYKESCGCCKRENFIKYITKHGQQKNPYYTIWYNFNDRCYDKNCENYKHYGGRGISVCDEWRVGQENEQGLLNFIQWCESNPKPNKEYSLDRKDNDGNYSPENCRWTTQSEQCKNKRNLKYFEEKIKQKDDTIEILKLEIQKLKNEK